MNIKIVLFFMSYAPLFIIYLINSLNNTIWVFKVKVKGISIYYPDQWLKICILILSIVIPTVIFLSFINLKKRKGKYSRGKIKKLKTTQDIVLGYLMTYILPFITDAKLDINNLILFGLIAILAVRLDIFYINPTLILLNYYIYEDEEECHYITRNKLSEIEVARKNSEYVRVIPLARNVFYILKIEN